jgi:hypothetical protein
MPLGGRQSGLARRCARALERADRAGAEMPRQIERLVESAGAAFGRMKWNRNHDVRPVEHSAAGLPD